MPECHPSCQTSGAVSPSGAFVPNLTLSGDLTGTLPAPTIAAGAVTAAKMASGAAVGNIGYTPFNATSGGTVGGPISATGAITGGTGNGGIAFAIPDNQSIRNTGNGSNVYFDFGIGGNNGGTLTFRTLSGTGGLITPLLLAPTGSAFNLPLSVVAQPIRNAPAGINENSGGYYSASCSWAPTASGTYISSRPTLNAGSISGVGAVAGSTCGIGGTPDLSPATAQMVLQVKTDDLNKAQLGLFVDLDDISGATSSYNGGQHPGIQVSGRRRDDPSFPGGPGPLWGLNLDTGDESNVAGFHANEELDYHNYSRPCAPLSNSQTGCFHVQTWHSYLTGFPSYADIFVNTQGQSLNYGTVNVSGGGTIVTLASLQAGGGCGTSGLNGTGVCRATDAPTTAGFSPDTTVINLGGSLPGSGTDYRVASVQSQNQLTLLAPYSGGNASGVAFLWSSHAVHNGYVITDSILPNGPLDSNNKATSVINATVSDNDMLLSSRAFTAVLVQGFHDQGLNTALDTGIRYAFLAKQGQKICLNVFSQCVSSTGSALALDSPAALPSLTTTGTATIGTLKTGTFVNTTCTNAGYVTIQDSTGTSRKVMICG